MWYRHPAHGHHARHPRSLPTRGPAKRRLRPASPEPRRRRPARLRHQSPRDPSGCLQPHTRQSARRLPQDEPLDHAPRSPAKRRHQSRISRTAGHSPKRTRPTQLHRAPTHLPATSKPNEQSLPRAQHKISPDNLISSS